MELAMTRATLAERLGVSVQTVLNVERDVNYNLGTKLLRQLETVLGVDFVVTMKGTKSMDDMIQMGSDEFILYIRKNFPENRTPNNQLGKRIWEWLQEQISARAEKRTEDAPCLWGDSGPFISPTSLPKTAAQFRFSRSILPALYAFLDNLGGG